MSLSLTILFRGPLKSCDYGCGYCPFAKRADGDAEQDADRQAVRRLVDWARLKPPSDALSIFFIPWGEALIRPWYQEAVVELTALPQVQKVVAQTNLSGPLAFLERCAPGKLFVWATFHPEWSPRDRFLAQTRLLRQASVPLSVGVVGLRRFRDEIAAMRRALPPEVYLWINAVKNPWGPGGAHPAEPYSAEDLAFLESIDPHFATNTREHASLGCACRTGSQVIAVDGAGAIRRCPFVPEVLGNLYEPSFERALVERPCPNATCGCHIGYVHLDRLQLAQVFGDRLLERIPLGWERGAGRPPTPRSS
jgi:hypothetical protein